MTAPDVTPRVTLAAIREQHEPVSCCGVHEYCDDCDQDWPCDTRIVLDAYDRDVVAVADGTYWAIGGALLVAQFERDAARADADRLAEVGEAVLAQAEHFTTGKLWDYELERMRAALAAHDAVIHPPDTAEYNPCVGGQD